MFLLKKFIAVFSAAAIYSLCTLGSWGYDAAGHCIKAGKAAQTQDYEGTEAARKQSRRRAEEKAAEIQSLKQAAEEEAGQALEARRFYESVSAADRVLLASIIFCEAGNQPYVGQVAVGAVVMNRVMSDVYPDTISEVIYQPGQFTPAMTGWLDNVLYSGGYTDAAYSAAEDALAGADPVEGCLYFGCGDWGIQIGDHYFH